MSPARVLDDVNERYVSRAKAAALYGVVIVGSEEDDDLAIDVAATEALRREMANGNVGRKKRQRARASPSPAGSRQAATAAPAAPAAPSREAPAAGRLP